MRARGLNSPHPVFPGATGVTATHADAIKFDETIGAPGDPEEGQLWYDPDSKTLSIQTNETDVVLQVGQEQHIRITNKTGAEITNGQLVYISGAQGNRPTADLAIADGSITPDVTIGFATHGIPDNQDGIVTSFGLVRDLNTLGCTAGDKIYLDPATPGLWTKTRPVAPNQIALVGYILVVNETTGIIFCRVLFSDTGIHSLPLVSTNPSAFTDWFLGHYIQVVAAQAIPQGTPYTSGTEFCNAQPSFDVTAVSAPCTLRIDGDSVDETTGTITAADSEDIAITAPGDYRSAKKWIGLPDFSVVEVGESITVTINKTRYWDSQNQDFRMLGMRWEFTPSNPSWSLSYTLSRVNNDGTLTVLETKTFTSADVPAWAVSNEPGTFKKTGLTHDFLGSEAEGLVVQIAASNIRYLYGDIKYTHI